MKTIAWIVLVINALISCKTFIKVFTDKTTVDRVANFIGVLLVVLTCLLAIHVIW